MFILNYIITMPKAVQEGVVYGAKFAEYKYRLVITRKLRKPSLIYAQP